MKKIKIFVAMLIVVTLLAGCSFNNNNTDAERFKEEYESINGQIRESDGKTIRSIEISKYNPFIYKNEDEIVEMMNNKETFVIYFGFIDCPWCRSVIPSLVEVANDLNIDKIYYVNVKDIRDKKSIDENGIITTTNEGTDGYKNLLKELDNVLDEYTITDKNNKKISLNEKRIYAPNVITVIDGKATGKETGISSKQTDGYMELTEEMKKETYDMFKNLLTPISNIIESCNDNSGC